MEEEVEGSRAPNKNEQSFSRFLVHFSTIFFVLPKIQKTLLNLSFFLYYLKANWKKLHLDLNIIGIYFLLNTKLMEEWQFEPFLSGWFSNPIAIP